MIDRHEAGWIEALFTEGPLACRTEDLHRYALLDCAFAPACHAAIEASVHADLRRSLYQATPNANQEVLRHSPMLLRLDAIERPVLEHLLGFTDGLPMLSFLHSRDSLENLYRRLSGWCMVDADGQAFVLRFPDTRRLPDVLHILTPQQLLQFCGPATLWHYRDRAARWESFTAADEVEVPPRFEFGLHRLDGDQCAALIDASEPDQILARLLHLEPDHAASHQPSTLHALGVQTVALADALKLDALAQRVQLCAVLCRDPQLASTSLRDAESLRILIV